MAPKRIGEWLKQWLMSVSVYKRGAFKALTCGVKTLSGASAEVRLVAAASSSFVLRLLSFYGRSRQLLTGSSRYLEAGTRLAGTSWTRSVPLEREAVYSTHALTQRLFHVSDTLEMMRSLRCGEKYAGVICDDWRAGSGGGKTRSAGDLLVQTIWTIWIYLYLELDMLMRYWA